MLTAHKPLPKIDSHKVISLARQQEFRERGHTLIREVLTPAEIGVYRPLIVDAVRKYRTERRRLSERDTYGKAFLQIMNLWRVDERVRQLVLSKRLARMAADLLGVGNVRLYHDQALFKEPGGGPTPWHQDQYYWPLDTSNTVTLWMPLVDVSIEMGMLTFASGSHRKGSILDQKISDESDTGFKKYIRDYQFPIVRAAGMQAGDTCWHYGNTVHSAPGNQSERMREVMTIIYIADGARVASPRNKEQEHDREAWLMGLPPGRLAASELNPLLL
jgi:ectoine hydroxylase-related dioxygenase (phytanoyl-CoA dioxygenase family)